MSVFDATGRLGRGTILTADVELLRKSDRWEIAGFLASGRSFEEALATVFFNRRTELVTLKQEPISSKDRAVLYAALERLRGGAIENSADVSLLHTVTLYQ